MGRLKKVSSAPRPGNRPLARTYPRAIPKMATTTVASKAACKEIASGFQTQGGMWSQFNHECGTSAVTITRRSLLRSAEVLLQPVDRRGVARSLAHCRRQ